MGRYELVFLPFPHIVRSRHLTREISHLTREILQSTREISVWEGYELVFVPFPHIVRSRPAIVRSSAVLCEISALGK